MRPFLERYLAGEYRSVWEELTALGGQVRQEPLRADAEAVAQETMRRVKANVEALVPRLTALGWRFGGGHLTGRNTPLIAPPPDAPALVDAMEAICGPIPLSLRAFYEIVGGIDLRGAHPDWTEFYDPLMAASWNEVLQDLQARQEWNEERGHSGKPAAAFALYYAPDFLVKEGFSGVGALYVAVPDPAADAPLSFEDQPLLSAEGKPITFVQSLRNAFYWGGFQGLIGTEAEFGNYRRKSDLRNSDPRNSLLPPVDRSALTDGLLPL